MSPTITEFDSTGFFYNLNLGSYTLTITGDANFDTSGSITKGTSTVKLGGNVLDCNFSNSGGKHFHNFVFEKSTRDIDLGGDTLYVDNDFTLTSGNYIDNGTIEVQGNCVFDDGNIVGTANVKLTGTSNQTVNANGGTGDVPNLEIASSATVTFSDTITTSGDFIHTSGTEDWTTNSATLAFGQDLTASRTITPSTDDYHNVTINDSTTIDLTANMVVKGTLFYQKIAAINNSEFQLHGDFKSTDISVS